MSRGPQPRGTVEDRYTVAPVPPVPVSGRVETRTPRPDTVHPLEKAALTVSCFAVLVILAFGPDWLNYAINH